MLRVLGTGSARQRQKRCAQCLRPVTADGIPIVGRLPGCSNGYIAVGHGAVGIQLSPVTGLAIAELITSGECTSCDLACFDLMRFAETVRQPAVLVGIAGRWFSPGWRLSTGAGERREDSDSPGGYIRQRASPSEALIPHLPQGTHE